MAKTRQIATDALLLQSSSREDKQAGEKLASSYDLLSSIFINRSEFSTHNLSFFAHIIRIFLYDISLSGVWS